MSEPERITGTHAYFWGSLYSQWFATPFMENGVMYSTAEQYMMSKKALLFGDTEMHEKIMKTHNPSNQKQLGRLIKNFDDKIWEQHREDIVTQGNYLKFSQRHDIKNYLLNQRDKILVEASPYDKIWGIGLSPDDDKVLDEKNWQGLNLLGKCIMRARDRIINEEKSKVTNEIK